MQHLAENRIGNEGAEAISDMLQKNDMIYSLDLSGNSIEDYGAEKLCRVLLVKSFYIYLDVYCDLYYFDKPTKKCLFLCMKQAKKKYLIENDNWKKKT